MNWDVVSKEIETLQWVTDYLELDDERGVAVMVVNHMLECGSLIKAMDLMLTVVADFKEEVNEEKVPEGEE